MRIIGGHDYYDNALAFGRDDDVVFVREKDQTLDGYDFAYEFVRDFRAGMRELSLRGDGAEYRPAYRIGEKHTVGGIPFTVTQRIVIFCGKVYHGIETEAKGERTVHWQRLSFERWLKSMKLRVVTRFMFGKQVDLDAEFSSYSASKRMLDWLIEQKIVIAIRGPARPDSLPRLGKPRPRAIWEWTINPPTLKAVEFYRVFDAYAAFQEIAMFVGGVLPGSARPMVTIADVTRLEKHGFDKVASFRHRK